MDEILKLARECGFLGTNPNGVSPALEAFYKAAYNKGIEDAAQLVLRTDLRNIPVEWQQAYANGLLVYAAAIRALEKK